MSDLIARNDDHRRPGDRGRAARGHRPGRTPARATQFPTGFEPLDDVARRWHPRPGPRARSAVARAIGKTVASLQWARWMAMQGHTAIYVCYEHSPALAARPAARARAGLARRAPDEVVELTRAAHASRRRSRSARRRPRHSPPTRSARRPTTASSSTAAPASRPGLGAADRRRRARRASSRSTATGSTALFVDYLQKVPVVGDLGEGDERTTAPGRAAEGARDGRRGPGGRARRRRPEGLTTRRLRLAHLRGSTALAHECDIAILLNEKCDRGLQVAPRVRPGAGRDVPPLGRSSAWRRTVRARRT